MVFNEGWKTVTVHSRVSCQNCSKFPETIGILSVVT